MFIWFYKCYLLVSIVTRQLLGLAASTTATEDAAATESRIHQVAPYMVQLAPNWGSVRELILRGNNTVWGWGLKMALRAGVGAHGACHHGG